MPPISTVNSPANYSPANSPQITQAESLDSLTLDILNSGLETALNALQNWVQSNPFEVAFSGFSQTVSTPDLPVLESLHQDWRGGNFSQLPAIKILSETELGGAKGAFAASTQTLYLASELLTANAGNPQAIARVLLEEIGHFIDAQANRVDTAGDEGALFAAQVLGLDLSPDLLAALQTEDDTTTLMLDGQAVQVEKADPYIGNNLDQFQSGLTAFLDQLEATIDQVIYAQNLPLIGSALESVTDGAVDFVAELRDAISSQLANLPELTPVALEQALNDALGANGLGWLQDLQVIEAADNLLFEVTLSRDLVELNSAELGLSLGETGLSLDVDGNAQVGVGFDLRLGLGLNTEGFYVDTALEDELSLTLSATLPDLEATATLGFLQMEATDNGSNLTSTIALDLQDSDDADTQLSFTEAANLVNTVDASLNGSASFNANLSSGTTISALPSIGTNLVLDWQFLNADLDEGFQTEAPTIAFNSVSLDMGSFFGGFLGPVFEGITQALDPVMPLVEKLNTPLPILDAKMVDVAQALAEAGLGNFEPETFEFLDYVTQIAEIISILGELSVDGSTITLGDFSVLAGEIEALQEDVDALGQIAGLGGGASSFASIVDTNPRFEFSILEQPETLVGLFLGQATDIFRLDLPTIGFGVQYETKIPIFGPISATLGGALGAAANLSFGFDTAGLAEFAAGGFENPAAIANGFFISTPSDPGTPPEPIDEDEVFTVGLGAGVEAGVDINLGVISGGVVAGLIAQLFLNLSQEKVPFSDFAVPGCLFELLGKLDAVVAAKLTIGFGPFSIRKRIEIIRETLLDFRAGCSGSTEDHQQATVGDGGEAVLSVGEAADNLTGINGIEEDEVVTVTHVSGVAGDETISVAAYGASWTYENVSRITADAGSGNDIIELVGVRSDAHLIGGEGDDELLGGQGADLLEGGDGEDYLSGGAGDDELFGEDGDDFLEGGAGNDLLDGGEGFDGVSYSGASSGVQIDLTTGAVFDGDGGIDTLISVEQIEGSDHSDVITGNNNTDIGDVIDGLAGDDVINGGDGDDFLIGGEGADTIDGGDGEDATSYLESKAGVTVDLQTGTVFSGGGSPADGDVLSNLEHVQGTFEDDVLRGDQADNRLHGAGGDDVIEGRGGADELYGGTGNDTAEYRSSASGVTVSLLADANDPAFSVAGQGGDAQGDRLAMATDNEGNPTDRNSFENLTGSLLGDTLTGDGGRNILRGLAGDDTLNGGEGNDTLIGGVGADAHNGGGGLDWADYSESNAGVTVDLALHTPFSGVTATGGHAEGDTFLSTENLKGSNFADNLRGNGVNNDINPGLRTGPGIDIVHGGGETSARGDRLILDYSNAFASLQGGYDYATGSTDAGAFVGTVEFDDIEQLHIVASAFGDTIRGGVNDDFINAGAGNDTIFGGQGQNFIYADDGNDTVTNLNDAFGNVFYTPDSDAMPIYWIGGGAGIDTFSGNFANETQAIVLTSLDPDTENPDQIFTPGNGSVIHQFERFQNLQTGSGNDRLTQLGRVNNDFRTGAGDDIIHAGLGFDSVNGGIDGFSSGEHAIPGDDLLIVDYSAGDIGGGLQSEFIINADGIFNRYYRYVADSRVTLLDEVQFSQIERVHIDGTQQADNIIGLNRADELRGHDGNDIIDGRGGNDQMAGGAGNDLLIGGSGEDDLSGDAGNDIVIGGEGDDSLNGGAGNDILIGINFGEVPFPAGAEVDTMTGGRGADWFWLGDGLFPYYDDGNLFSEGSQNQAIITDFTPAEGDVIFLHGAASDYTLQTEGDSTRILRNGFRPDLIGTIQGVTGLSLNSDAFQFVDDEANGENRALLLPAVQKVREAARSSADFGKIDAFQVPDDPQAALLLPAVQAAREAARRTSSQTEGRILEAGLVAPTSVSQANLPPAGTQLAPSQTKVIVPGAAAAIPANPGELAENDNTFSITQQNSPTALLNTFLGDTTGLTVLDAQVTGDARAFGTFQYDPFGLGNGIVLSTGKVTDLVGENQVDGGFVGNASIPLDFVRLASGGGPGLGGGLGLGGNTLLNPRAVSRTVDDFVANPENPNPPETPNTAIFRANLSELSQIQSLTITDSGLGIGGAGGERSGFDLVGLKLSNVLIDDAASIDDIPGIDLFDFSPLSTFLTPGTQRPSSNPAFPESSDLFGTLFGQVNNEIATLNAFDFDGNSGFLSLGDGGSVGFNLTETLTPDAPLYLYVGEAGNNGESLAGQVTASAQRINGQNELSTDFGAPGAEGDTTRLSFTFEADGTAEQVYFRFAFASEEFVELGGDEFNDAFSLKLNGFNLARLSDGAEVNINNLVTNPFGNYHPDFVHNPVGDGPASDQTPLDGYTVLTFAGPVNPNSINQLEIEVKDVGDGWKDTAVFLQAGSFGTSETPKGGFSFFPSVSTLPEGESSFVTLKLNTVPTETVKIRLDPDAQLDLGKGAGNPLDVFFTPEDALTPRQIAFTAFDDTLVEGLHSGFISATVHSTAPSYSSLQGKTVEQFIIDNDTAPVGVRDPLVGRNPTDPLVGKPVQLSPMFGSVKAAPPTFSDHAFSQQMKTTSATSLFSLGSLESLTANSSAPLNEQPFLALEQSPFAVASAEPSLDLTHASRF